VVNEFGAKHRRVPVIKPESVPSHNRCHSTVASESGQSSFDAYDLSSDDKQYLTPNNVAETTPGRSNRAAPFLTASLLNFNSPPEEPNNWRTIN